MYQIIGNIVRNIFNRVTKTQTQPLLGRWKINYDQKVIQSKIYWSNVDHCGCCHLKQK